MSEAVGIAIIGLFQAVLVALIAKITIDGRRAKKATQAVQADTKVVRKEVKNSHSTNLREDLDRQHDAVMAEFRGTRKDIGRLDERDMARGNEIRDLSRKLDAHLEWSRTWSADQEQADRTVADRVRNIEDTLNPGKDTP